MLQRNSFYKGVDILNEDNRIKMKNFLNPYEYNFESNLKDKINTDIENCKSKNHNRCKNIKK